LTDGNESTPNLEVSALCAHLDSARCGLPRLSEVQKSVLADASHQKEKMNIHPLTWIKAHPYKAVLFSALFVLVSGCAGAATLPWTWFAAVYGPLIVIWLAVMARDSRFLPIAVLIAVFVTPPSRPKAEAGIVPVVVGVTVVVVGGIAIYKIVNFCQRHFSPQPKATNDPPEFSFDGPADCGATLSFSAVGSCYEPPAGLAVIAADTFADAPETPFRLEIVVSGDGSPSIAAFQVEPAADQVDWDTEESQLADLGLTLSPYGGWADSYSVNGLACGPEDCPISFDQDGTSTLNLGGPLHRVLIERTHGLSQWDTVMATVVPANLPMVLTDTCSEGMTIYRVSAQ